MKHGPSAERAELNLEIKVNEVPVLPFHYVLTGLLTLATPLGDTPLNPMTLGTSPEAVAVAQAAEHLKEQAWADAKALLETQSSAGAFILKVRAARLEKNFELASQLLTQAPKMSGPLATLLTLEKIETAHALKANEEALKALTPLLRARNTLARAHIETAAHIAESISTETLIKNYELIKEAAPNTSNTRSFLMGKLAEAYRKQGKSQEAAKLERARFLDEPLASSSPRKIPVGAKITFSNLLGRAQKILDAHLNETALKALKQIPYKRLESDQLCQWHFIHGMAHRKLHNYSDAETSLMKAAKICKDSTTRRKAAYVGIKVITIRSGLRAIEPIESFTKEFAGHSMVDDVLFWAGDLHQRRQQTPQAIGYYKRIQSLPVAGDFCAEASWREAWMAFRAENYQGARDVLRASVERSECTKKSDDRARALYWLGRVEAELGRPEKAIANYRKVIDKRALSYYAQLALTRLKELKAPKLASLLTELKAPASGNQLAMCPGELSKSARFRDALTLLDAGLKHEAGQLLKQSSAKAAPSSAAACSGHNPGVLLALLLDRAGEHRDAHWRLRTAFSQLIHKKPSAREGSLLRAAYPLAYRRELGASENEHKIPSLFLQALAREESAFDPAIVSWAGAYGLTQLLLTTAQGAGKLLKPKIKVSRTTELLDPALNARLGGAFLSSLIQRFDGSLGLALCGYNAALRTATTWWHRHSGEPFDVFTEELTIRETRKYVKRVHQTWGIYRWLYEGIDPALPIEPIPASPKKG